MGSDRALIGLLVAFWLAIAGVALVVVRPAPCPAAATAGFGISHQEARDRAINFGGSAPEPRELAPAE